MPDKNIEIEKTNTPPFQYRDFLLKNPYSLIYSTPEFINFLNNILDGESHYLIARKNGTIVGAFVYFKVYNPKYGVVINSLPWYGSYGGCILSKKEDSEIRRILLENYANEIKKEKKLISATLIISPFEADYFDEYLEIVKPQFIDLRIGQINNLPKKGKDLENRLIMSFKQKTRNLVRKALKQNFSLIITDEEWAWEFLYNTHVENMKAIGGKAKPKEHFRALRQFIPKKMREIFVALKDNLPIAALLLCYFNKTVEYITPVIKHEFRSQQPLSFLIWHAMLKAIKEGFRWWNWGGTWLNQKSLHHFKAGWGAVDIEYKYLINVPVHNISIIKTSFHQLIESFPYYYIFPINLLNQNKDDN